MPALDVLPLPEAKAHLNMDPAGSTHDTELTRFVEAAVAVVERHVGQALHPREVVETARVGGNGAVLAQVPVTELLAVTAAATSLDVTAWRVDALTGLLTGPARGEVTVTYLAGWVTAPPHYKLATAMVVGELWKTQRVALGGRRMGGTEAEAELVARGVLPPAAMQLLGPPAPVVG